MLSSFRGQSLRFLNKTAAHIWGNAPLTNPDLLICGSGPAGCTAGLYAARAGLKTVILDGNLPGGQLMNTGLIENFPSFQGTGPKLMEQIRQQTMNAGAVFEFGSVTKVQKDGKLFKVVTEFCPEYRAKSLIIATGANPLKLGVPGEDKFWGFGVSSCAHCDGPLFKDKNVLVVGAGNTAVTEALYLANICKKVTMLVRSQIRAQKVLQERLQASSVEIRKGVVSAINGDKSVKSVTVGDSKIDVDGVFVAIGHKPASDVFKNLVKVDSKGFIAHEGANCSIPGVFVAGDVGEPTTHQAVSAAGSGCRAADAAIQYLNSL